MFEANIAQAKGKVSFGIDVHKSSFVVTAVKGGEFIKRAHMPACGEAVIGFIRANQGEGEPRSCYEAGFSGFWLHRHLTSRGINNIVVHPASVGVEAGNKVKTDKRDSLKLARQLDANMLRGIYVPTEAQEYARLLTRTREQLVRARTRARIQARMKLHQFGLFSADLSRVLTLREAERMTAQIPQVELRSALEVLISQWSHLSSEIKKLGRALERQAEADPNELTYRSVPGIGVFIARLLSNELGDMSQFRNEKALYSFTGLTPCEFSSGDKIRRGHISRQGSSRIRHALTEASWRAMRKDLRLRKDFERIAKRRGAKRAIVAIARKLIGRVRAIFKDKGVYELEHKKAA
jgi:transposase